MIGGSLRSSNHKCPGWITRNNVKVPVGLIFYKQKSWPYRGQSAQTHAHMRHAHMQHVHANVGDAED